jgi:hypothetical protein
VVNAAYIWRDGPPSINLRRVDAVVNAAYIWRDGPPSINLRRVDAVVNAAYIWRDGRVVECGGLENRCPPIGGPGVRIPLSPQNRLLPREAGGFLFYRLTNQACLSEARWKIKSSYE